MVGGSSARYGTVGTYGTVHVGTVGTTCWYIWCGTVGTYGATQMVDLVHMSKHWYTRLSNAWVHPNTGVANKAQEMHAVEWDLMQPNDPDQ